MVQRGFSRAEAAYVAGVPASTLEFWDRSGVVVPSVLPARGIGSRRIYAVDDLVLLRVAARLRDAGLGIPALQTVMRALRAQGSLADGPTDRCVVTDGRRVAVVSPEALPQTVEALGTGLAVVVGLGAILEAVRTAIHALAGSG